MKRKFIQLILFSLIGFGIFTSMKNSSSCPEKKGNWFDSNYSINVIDFAIEEPYLYLINNDLFISIFNISDKSNPTLINKFEIQYKPIKIFSKKDKLVLLDSNNLIHILNLSNYPAISEISKIQLDGLFNNIYIKNDYIYILTSDTLKIYKLNKEINLELISSFKFQEEIISSFFYFDFLFVNLKSSKISILDLKDPEYPYIISNYNLNYFYRFISANDAYLIAVKEDGFSIFKINEDFSFSKFFEETNILNLKKCFFQGSYFILLTEKSILIYDLNNGNVKKISEYFKDDFIYDLKIFGNYIYLNLGESGFEIIDINNCCEKKPMPFDIFKPEVEGFDGLYKVIFDWTESSGAIYYDFYIGKNYPPDNKIEYLSNSKVEVLLEEKGIYYFKVVAKNGCGEFSSDVNNFYFSPPGYFYLLYPENGAIDVPLSVDFDWTDSIGADYYNLYLGKTVPPPLYQSNITESHYFVSGLEFSEEYIWYVKAINNDGSTNSRKFSFKTKNIQIELKEIEKMDLCQYGGYGNANGVPEPGENIYLIPYVFNKSGVEIERLTGVLKALSDGVEILVSNVTFPEIPAGGTVPSLDPFLINIYEWIPCFSVLNFEIEFKYKTFSYVENFSIEVGKQNHKVIFENFEEWPPQDWQIKNNDGDCIWESSSTTGLPNYTGGSEYCAVADSDFCGENTKMDTELWTPEFSLPYASTSTLCQPYGSFPPYATAATLNFKVSYKDGLIGNDNFSIDISKDEGITWQNLIFWDESHSPFTGEIVNLDLTPFAPATNLIIRFVYKTLSWLFWAEVDDVELNIPYNCTICKNPPQNFNLLFPQNNSTGNSFNLTLDWEDSMNAGCYNLYFGTANPPPLYVSHIQYSNYEVTLLMPGTWYYWKVEAINENRIIESQSGIFSFRTKSQSSPKEVPKDGLKVLKNNDQITLLWQPSCGQADNYTIYEGNLLNLVQNGIYDHHSIICNDTGNDLTETFYPSENDSYYIVVPRSNDGVEGSYSFGRPQGENAANCNIVEWKPQDCNPSYMEDGIYYGYLMQTNNGDWEGYINSPFDFKIEEGYLTEIDSNDFGMVYITPSNYVILLSYTKILDEPVPIELETPFEINYQKEYYDDAGKLVLRADYHFYIVANELKFLTGFMDVNVVALDPGYNAYAGHFYFNFESGISENLDLCGDGKYFGYFMQTNNGDWEGFINAPLNVTVDNWNITAWDEDDRGIVYITPSNYVILLGYGGVFDAPIPISDGQPFNISYSLEYVDDSGRIVLIGDYIIDGTLTCNYLTGTLTATVTALDPQYRDYAGKFYWNFEGGEESFFLSNKKNPSFRNRGFELKKVKLLKAKLKGDKKEKEK